MNPLGGAPFFILVIVFSVIWQETLSSAEDKEERKVTANRTAGSSGAQSRYETLEEILPLVSFKCKNRAPGYYADPRFECEVIHFCHPDGSRVTIPCPKASAHDHRLRHRICTLRNEVSKGCGQNEIYLALPEDLVKIKDTTSSVFNAATDFKFQTVLPQPTSPVDDKEGKPTTPLSPEDEALKFHSSAEIINGKVVPLVTEEARNYNPFFIEKPGTFQSSPASFSRGSKPKSSENLPFQEPSETHSDVHFLKTVYLKKQNIKKNTGKREDNPLFILDPKSSNMNNEAIRFLLEVFNKNIQQPREFDNSSFQRKPKQKQKLLDAKVSVRKDLPGLHPRRRRKRMAIAEIAGSRPYAIFYAKVPETARLSVQKPEVQIPTARVPSQPKPQTVELTFNPSIIPKNIQAVPIAIRVPNKKSKKSRPKKKRPKPQVIYENPSDIPQDGLENPQVSEQRNFYYYYPQQAMVNPYLSGSPAYIVTSNDNQRPQYPEVQVEPQQRNPQQGPERPDSGSPPRQQNIPVTAQHSPASDSQTLRNEQTPQHQTSDRSPLQFQPPSNPQISSQSFPYGPPQFMQNLPPPYENLPTYQNIPPQSQPRPQQPRQPQPQGPPPPAPPPTQNPSPTPSQIPTELRQNRPSETNNNQNANFPPPRNIPQGTDIPGNQQSTFGFFPTSFQSPFFQGFPPLPDFGNPFLPQPAVSRPEQLNEQFHPISPNQQSPSQQFQGGPNVHSSQPPQQYPVRPPQEFSEPQGPLSLPRHEEPGPREPRPFIENNDQNPSLSNERNRPNRRPKRPRPEAPGSTNDGERFTNRDRSSRPRNTRPPHYDDETNIVVPPMREQRQRPQEASSPPRQVPRNVAPTQFSGNTGIIPSNRPSRPNSEHYDLSPADYPDSISTHDQRFRRPESVNQYSPRPDSYSPPSDRGPQRPSSRPAGNNDDGHYIILQNGQRLSRPGENREERHYYIPENKERPSEPPSSDHRPFRGSQNRQRPSRPVEETDHLSYRPQSNQRPSTDNDHRQYRPQNQPEYSRFTDEDRLSHNHQNNVRPSHVIDKPYPQSRKPQSTRRPSVSSSEEDQYSYRTRNTRKPAISSSSEEEHLYRIQNSRRPSGSSTDEGQRSHRTQNSRKPSGSSRDEDQRSYQTQNSRRPSGSSDNEDQRSYRTQNSRKPPGSSRDEERQRSYRTQNSRRPSEGPSHPEEDHRSNGRPGNSQGQRSSSGNNRSHRPPNTERPYTTTSQSRFTHTTQVHLPRDSQSYNRPTVTIDEYRNVYYPATTITPNPTSFAYTIPQTTRPAYRVALSESQRPSTESQDARVRHTERSRNYVTSPDQGISNLVQTERSRSITSDRPKPYVDYHDDGGRPISENQVNVVSGAGNYNSRTHSPPRAESYQDRDNSRERGRVRYTTYSPVTESRYQPGRDDDSSYVTYSQPRTNRQSSNSIADGERRNRNKDRTREEPPTTPLPRTTRKPKPIPPRPTFPSFPTFPPPPQIRTTTTERQTETTTVPQSSRIQYESDPSSAQYIQPKKRLNSRPRTTTALPVIIGTSTSVHRQIDEKYEIDEEAATRPPQKKRSRKRTRTRQRRPRPTTTLASVEEESSLLLEDRKEEVVSQPTRKSYRRRGRTKSTTSAPTTTTLTPAKSQEPDSSDEYGSRIKLFGRQRTRKTTLKYTPRVSSTTSKPVAPEASEPRKTLQSADSGTPTRARRPYKKRTRTRTTTALPDFDESTDLNIARSDENVETLKYQDLPLNSMHSTTYPEESTPFYASTEPYNEFILDSKNSQEATEKSLRKQDFDFETTIAPTTRPRIWKFGKPKLVTN